MRRSAGTLNRDNQTRFPFRARHGGVDVTRISSISQYYREKLRRGYAPGRTSADKARNINHHEGLRTENARTTGAPASDVRVERAFRRGQIKCKINHRAGHERGSI